MTAGSTAPVSTITGGGTCSGREAVGRLITGLLGDCSFDSLC